MKLSLIMLIPLLLISCMVKPTMVKPVTDFELDRYLGKWYEIARLDHRFERGLQNVTAIYSLKDDGKVKVVNRGFSTKSTKWKTAIGKAKFAIDKNLGFLKVSFFGPFYGSYIIFELDQEDYSYAFVAGDNTSYLWFLSRTPTVSDKQMEHFLISVKKLGFNTDELIFVNQDKTKMK